MLSGISATTADDGGAAAAAAAAAGAGAGGGEAAGAGASAAFYESFGDETLKTSPSIQRYKTVEDLARGYINAEQRLGVNPEQLLRIPADPNDQAAYDAIFAKLGRPEKADGYGFQLADGASDADKAKMGEFAEVVHKAGLLPGQAKALGEWINQQTASLQQAQTEAFAAQAAEGRAALQKEWGSAYDARVKEIGSTLAKYGDEALVKELDGDKLGNYPNLARFIGKMLDRMAEPGAAGGGSGDAAGADRPMTPAQASAALQALQGDPQKAAALFDNNHAQHAAVLAERDRLLMLQAGRQPA